MKIQKGLLRVLITLVLILLGRPIIGQELPENSQERRAFFLGQLTSVVLPDHYRRSATALVPTPVDSSWTVWVERTGELPPDFKKLPTLPFLPNPLIIDEGERNIPVETTSQWLKKREWIKEQTEHWITGVTPPAPTNMKSTILAQRHIGNLTEKDVLLEFGPKQEAQLHITLLIPPGEGPFPVFICPWKKDRNDWVQAAVRRGYIGVRFTATDPKYGFPDDSEAYEEIWWPEYDFSAITRWAWAASRTVDYLYSLPFIESKQIALTGLSRNGKMALWAAAYDQRITAVVPISGGTGGENPTRYTTDKYSTEPIELLTRVRPHWLHPRLRFFVGRENKLPVDQNSLMALVAPRGLMLSSSITETAGNHWAAEQAFRSAKTVYDFLGADDKIAIDLRQGLHAPSARDMERYLDFFDFTFDRGDIKPDNKLYHNYSFSKWLGLSGEMVNPLSYQPKGIDDLLLDTEGDAIVNIDEWNKKERAIKERIRWALGEEPSSVGPGHQPDYMREVVGRPRVNENIGSRDISFGTLYYPINSKGEPIEKELPVVLYLHEYSYATGIGKLGNIINSFTENGFAVYVHDQIGFGTRIEEGRLFYERFANWSKMGRMVADLRWVLDELAEVDFLDQDRVLAGGYSLGGTVALYSAALDDRIDGVIAVNSFTPMRLDYQGRTAEGIYRYSHLHGLLPRLGFFAGNEDRIPYDFHEILAAVAPRPLLVVAATWDQYNSFEDVSLVLQEVTNVYELYGADGEVQLVAPQDYNRFSPEMKNVVVAWAREHFK